MVYRPALQIGAPYARKKRTSFFTRNWLIRSDVRSLCGSNSAISARRNSAFATLSPPSKICYPSIDRNCEFRCSWLATRTVTHERIQSTQGMGQRWKELWKDERQKHPYNSRIVPAFNRAVRVDSLASRILGASALSA